VITPGIFLLLGVFPVGLMNENAFLGIWKKTIEKIKKVLEISEI
jgi:hypothetical protein